MGNILNSVHGNNHEIQKNFVQLCDTEFREIPWNFRQFRTEHGSTKNRRNSALTEFRGHPSNGEGEGVTPPPPPLQQTFGQIFKGVVNGFPPLHLLHAETIEL